MKRGISVLAFFLMAASLVFLFSCTRGGGQAVGSPRTAEAAGEGAANEGVASGGHYERGSSLIDIGQFEEAVRELDEALKLEPKHANAYILRGIAFAELGDMNRSFADFNMAAELEPDNAFAYINRGRANELVDNQEAACADWRRACELDMCNYFDIALAKGKCQF